MTKESLSRLDSMASSFQGKIRGTDQHQIVEQELLKSAAACDPIVAMHATEFTDGAVPGWPMPHLLSQLLLTRWKSQEGPLSPCSKSGDKKGRLQVRSRGKWPQTFPPVIVTSSPPEG